MNQHATKEDVVITRNTPLIRTEDRKTYPITFNSRPREYPYSFGGDHNGAFDDVKAIASELAEKYGQKVVYFSNASDEFYDSYVVDYGPIREGLLATISRKGVDKVPAILEAVKEGDVGTLDEMGLGGHWDDYHLAESLTFVPEDRTNLHNITFAADIEDIATSIARKDRLSPQTNSVGVGV